MGLLHDLSTKYKTLSIVGMAKNAGKTTALNYLIEEAIDEGITLGITSTGRDGETQDLELPDTLPTPQEIKTYMDRYIIGQDDAKVALSVAAKSSKPTA